MREVPAPAVALRAAGATDVGRQRLVNEDRFYVDAARGIFIVVDGLGGEAAGEWAAQTAVTVMAERLSRRTGPPADRLREAITIANNEIHRLGSSRPEWRGMACVATAAIVSGDRATVGHVGDSRLYRLQRGRLEKITPDHSPVGAREDAHELSEIEAMRHPRRNEVYRDVGSEPHASDDPDFVFIAEVDLLPGAALLLCSDGLTDQVSSDEIREVVGTYAGSPDAVARALVDAANDAGGKDNVTVVYVERAPGVAAAANAGSSTPREVTRSGAAAISNGTKRPGRRWPTVAALVVGTAIGLGAAFVWPPADWPIGRAAPLVRSTPPSTIVVHEGESIMAAVATALPGTTVMVEPGEYRERLTLRDDVRIVSRVSRQAVLRLPGTAAESEPAVVAAGVRGAELSGLRIVGDAAAPLGIGVITRDAAVRLTDLDVSGAATAAFDFGPGDETSLTGSDVHDNTGAAVIVRPGATARLAHNVFTRNGSSERLSAPFVVEGGATPAWRQNVFSDVTPAAITGLDAGGRAALHASNWFITPPPATPAAARRRGGAR